MISVNFWRGVCMKHLELIDIKKYYGKSETTVKAVDGISLSLIHI